MSAETPFKTLTKCYSTLSDEDGIIINIGPNFDLSGSFQAAIDKQENNVIDNVFYGINGESPFANGSQIKIGASKVYITESKYEEYKDSDRLRDVTVLSGKYIPARNPDTGDAAWIVAAIAMTAMAMAVLLIKKKKED